MSCEIADYCKQCQREHIKNKGYLLDKDKLPVKEWPVQCKGIQKQLFDDTYYNEKTGEFQVQCH